LPDRARCGGWKNLGRTDDMMIVRGSMCSQRNRGADPAFRCLAHYQLILTREGRWTILRKSRG
jgi:hypothetical protein